MFINNNSRFCPLCIWKISPPNILGECKYTKENIKTKDYIDNELKSDSDSNDSDSDSDKNNNNNNNNNKNNNNSNNNNNNNNNVNNE